MVEKLRRKRRLGAKILLAASSCVLTLLAVEAAYRVKLYVQVGHLPQGISASYVLYNEQCAVPDERFGYTLLANGHLVGLRVTDQEPVLMYERFTNELGNYEPPKPHYEDAEVKVLVFGDSYTAIYGDGTVWPTILEETLRDRLGKDVCVLNFARDGYGLLEMLELASAKVPQFRPDLILICFISDDIDRAKSVDSTRKREVPSGFFDPLVTRMWCERMLKSQDPSDPLLAKYNRKFELAKQNASRVNYFTLSTSFLYNRLVKEDPFHHLPSKALNPRTALDSFSDDASCRRNIETLRQLQIPFRLIHLPEYRELQAGKYLLNGQQAHLLRSLERLMDCRATELLERMDEIDDPKALFLLPYDPHPSPKGLRAYARAVNETLPRSDFVSD